MFQASLLLDPNELARLKGEPLPTSGVFQGAVRLDENEVARIKKGS
jgi:hypothetical protein